VVRPGECDNCWIGCRSDGSSVSRKDGTEGRGAWHPDPRRPEPAKPAALRPIFGRYTSVCSSAPAGIDDRRWCRISTRSRSRRETFETDIADHTKLRAEIVRLADRPAHACARARWQRACVNGEDPAARTSRPTRGSVTSSRRPRRRAFVTAVALELLDSGSRSSRARHFAARVESATCRPYANGTVTDVQSDAIASWTQPSTTSARDSARWRSRRRARWSPAAGHRGAERRWTHHVSRRCSIPHTCGVSRSR